MARFILGGKSTWISVGIVAGRISTSHGSFFLETFRRAHVYDVLRAQLPTLELDAVFEAKEELALAVKNALSETMTVRISYLISPYCICSSSKSNFRHLFLILVCILGFHVLQYTGILLVLCFLFRPMDIKFYRRSLPIWIRINESRMP